MIRISIALAGCCAGMMLSLTPLVSGMVSWPPSPVRTFSGVVSAVDPAHSLIFIETNGTVLQLKYNAATLFSEVIVHTASTPSEALAMKTRGQVIQPGTLIFARVGGTGTSFFSSRITALSIR